MPSLPASRTPLPVQPFFNSPQQRVELARERFFERGERPTGLVSEAVLQSWARCLGARCEPQRAIEFDPVSRARIRAALERSRDLVRAAHLPLAQLEQALAGSGCRVLLTDDAGVLVRAPVEPLPDSEPVLRCASRVGVSLDERRVGTNAPGLVLRTGAAAAVNGAEHFYANTGVLSCVAAPIGDGRGGLAGVLDLTVEGQPFAFDAAAVVGLYAAMIENDLMLARARGSVVVRFQVAPGLLDGPMQALAGFDGDGSLAWCNAAARRLLGLPADHRGGIEHLFGLPLANLVQSRGAAPSSLPLPNGLTVWAQVGMPVHGRGGGSLGGAAPGPARAPADGVPWRGCAELACGPEGAGAAPGCEESSATAAAPAAGCEAAGEAGASPPTLDQHTRETIRQAVEQCAGNLSAAARRLGVSRGLLYRRLRD